MSRIHFPSQPAKLRLGAALAVAGLALSGCLQEPASDHAGQTANQLSYSAISAPRGGIVGSVSQVTAGNTVISGVTEWNHYGASTVSSVTKGVNSPNKITKTNIGTISAYQPSPLPNIQYLKWSNSTPSSPTESRNGILAQSVGAGFKLELPASTQARVALLYVTVYKAIGSLKAEIIGESFPVNVIPVTALSTEGYKTYCFKIYYKAPVDRKLTLTWTKTQDLGTGFVALHAVSYNNYTDNPPTVRMVLSGTTEWEQDTDFEMGMHVVTHLHGVAARPVNDDDVQPEGIRQLTIYENGKVFLSEQGYYGKIQLRPVPAFRNINYYAVVTDNFGNSTTSATEQIHPWYDVNLSGPRNIPDGFEPGIHWTNSANYPVPEAQGFIMDVRAKIDVSHTWDSDLIIKLWTKSADEINLWTLTNRSGGSDDGFISTIFGASYPTPIEGGAYPYAGKYRPSAIHWNLPLNTWSDGIWKIHFADVANQDVGVVYSARVWYCLQ